MTRGRSGDQETDHDVWESDCDLLERLGKGWSLLSVSHELANLKQMCFPDLGKGLTVPSIWMDMGVNECLWSVLRCSYMAQSQKQGWPVWVGSEKVKCALLINTLLVQLLKSLFFPPLR